METRKTVQQLPPDNAKGKDVIPSGVYMYKVGGSNIGEKLRETFHCTMYVKKRLSYKIMIHLYNQKEILRSVTTVTTTKAFSMKYLNVYLAKTGLIPESRRGVKKDRGIIDPPHK